jgi:hypothetical protein
LILTTRGVGRTNPSWMSVSSTRAISAGGRRAAAAPARDRNSSMVAGGGSASMARRRAPRSSRVLPWYRAERRRGSGGAAARRLREAHVAASGQPRQEGRARQCSAPASKSAYVKARALMPRGLAAASCSSIDPRRTSWGSLPSAARAVTRAMLTSWGGTVDAPNARTRNALAVYAPTPGSERKPASVSGQPPAATTPAVSCRARARRG